MRGGRRRQASVGTPTVVFQNQDGIAEYLQDQQPGRSRSDAERRGSMPAAPFPNTVAELAEGNQCRAVGGRAPTRAPQGARAVLALKTQWL